MVGAEAGRGGVVGEDAGRGGVVEEDAGSESTLEGGEGVDGGDGPKEFAMASTKSLLVGRGRLVSNPDDLRDLIAAALGAGTWYSFVYSHCTNRPTVPSSHCSQAIVRLLKVFLCPVTNSRRVSEFEESNPECTVNSFLSGPAAIV
jgi:hypothetical protein